MLKKPVNKIPENLLLDSDTQYLLNQGLKLIHQGKVRNTFKLDKNKLLILATDRISIFDFVLNAVVPFKGEVLTAQTHFWGLELKKPFPLLETHLVQSSINPLFNAAYDLKKALPNLPIQKCLVVKNLQNFLDPFELIFRKHIGGSVYADYQKNGIVAGKRLPFGLAEWDELNEIIFTPSTKEVLKHDENISAKTYFNAMGPCSQLFINILKRVYQYAHWFAREKGIIIFDTKFEGSSELLCLADEFLTPDSSRFVEEDEWICAQEDKRQPAFLDKQEIRDWGTSIEVKHQIKTINLKKLRAENQMDINAVHTIKVPDDIIKSLSDNYLYLFKKLTGYDLFTYQKKFMGIV